MNRVRLTLSFTLIILSYLLPWFLASRVLVLAGKVGGAVEANPTHFIPTF